MKKIIATLLLALLSAAAMASVTAMWTGRSEAGFSVTGQSVWRCEYMYGNQKFWLTMRGACQGTVEME